MEEEIIEINLSGFCRTCNSMQTVTCEYIPTEERQETGCYELRPQNLPSSCSLRYLPGSP